MTEIDEDNLDRSETDTPEIPGELIPEFPAKLGKPKTTGKAADLDSMLRDTLQFHYDVMMGKEFWVSGPTGKKFKRAGTFQERQASAFVVGNKILEIRPKGAADIYAEPLPDPEAEDLRKAVLEDLMARVPVVESPKPVADPTGGEVISISDPAEIAKFDADLAATPNKPRKDPNRLDLGEGFYALRDIDRANGRERWACFNSANEHCGYKSTPEAARFWFENNTAAGLALKERGAA
jgi:hypothetical protein